VSSWNELLSDAPRKHLDRRGSALHRKAWPRLTKHARPSALQRLRTPRSKSPRHSLTPGFERGVREYLTAKRGPCRVRSSPVGRAPRWNLSKTRGCSRLRDRFPAIAPAGGACGQAGPALYGCAPRVHSQAEHRLFTAALGANHRAIKTHDFRHYPHLHVRQTIFKGSLSYPSRRGSQISEIRPSRNCARMPDGRKGMSRGRGGRSIQMLIRIVGGASFWVCSRACCSFTASSAIDFSGRRPTARSRASISSVYIRASDLARLIDT
jgi:hypothetical protein